MIRQVLRMGDPRLLEKARPVETFNTPELHALLADMRDTMAHFDGAGLAAPQIGVGLQVVIFGVHRNPRYPDAEEVPDTVLVNPLLEPLGDEMEEGWEGCLSVPGMRGIVPRYRRLRYRGFDERGSARSSARSKGFTPGSCNMRSTTSTASCTRCGSATSRDSGLSKHCSPATSSSRVVLAV